MKYNSAFLQSTKRNGSWILIVTLKSNFYYRRVLFLASWVHLVEMLSHLIHKLPFEQKSPITFCELVSLQSIFQRPRRSVTHIRDQDQQSITRFCVNIRCWNSIIKLFNETIALFISSYLTLTHKQTRSLTLIDPLTPFSLGLMLSIMRGYCKIRALLEILIIVII